MVFEANSLTFHFISCHLVENAYYGGLNGSATSQKFQVNDTPRAATPELAYG